MTTRPAATKYAFDISAGGVVVIAHADAPDDPTFDRFLDFCDARRSRIRSYLILAGGGAPTARQRSRSLARHPHLFPVKTAVLARERDELTLALTVLKHARPAATYATFGPDELEPALSFLEVCTSDVAEVAKVLVHVAGLVHLAPPPAALRALR